MLEDKIYAELETIVGQKNVSRDPAILDTYAWQYAAEMLTKANWMWRPEAVVLPGTVEEIAALVKLCNREKLQYKAISTGFGAMGGASTEGMIQLDLRRLDRILEIDEKNMYAVIEPYVTGTALQVEAMRQGLNTHIIGAGGQTSVLASATSVMGQSWDGIFHGFSGRNLMGVEWVTPTGEIVQVGSLGASGKWFSGDGPGPSLRGVMRGFAGALGGLGVFTKCAVKLFPWCGPAEVESLGRSPSYDTPIPERLGVYLCILPDWERFAEAAYKIGEAEIGLFFGRNAPVLTTAIATENNNDFLRLWGAQGMHETQYNFSVIIGAHSAAEFDYQESALFEILDETAGGVQFSNRLGPKLAKYQLRTLAHIVRKTGVLRTLRDLPVWTWFIGENMVKKGPQYLPGMMFQAQLKNNFNMRGIFRFGGSFWTSLGSLEAIDNSVKAAKVGEQVKRPFIEQKVLFDDGGDNAWGGLYESGAYAHLEELAAYDPTDQVCKDHIMDFVMETNKASVEHSIGLSINAVSDLAHMTYNPATMNYGDYIRQIKIALDPNNAAEGTFYVIPDILKRIDLLMEAMNPPKKE